MKPQQPSLKLKNSYFIASELNACSNSKTPRQAVKISSKLALKTVEHDFFQVPFLLALSFSFLECFYSWTLKMYLYTR